MITWECTICGSKDGEYPEALCPGCKKQNIAIARVVHHANVAWNFSLDDPAPDPPFDVLPGWHKQYIIDRVALIRMGYGPETIHSEWVDLMLLRGWRLGDAKDPCASPPTHPCLKDFRELPPEQQKKDILAIAIVKALAS